MVTPITEHHTVVRPTMVPRLKEEGNRGTEVIMVPTGNYDPEAPPPPEPDPEPLTLVSEPGLTGDAIVGATITGTKAVYSGGVPPVEVQSQFQISDAASGSSWSGVDAWGTDSGGTHYIGPDDVGKYFRVAGRAIDSSEDSVSKAETLMSFSEVLGPVVADREPITVTTAAQWADLNDYTVGSTVYADTAHFEGGLEETTTYRWRMQTRPDADGSVTNGTWTNYTDHAEEVSYAITEAGDIRFQCQARDTGVDPVEQVNSFTGWQTVAALDPLVVGDPVATGEPYVGYTLSCTEPTVTGGSGDCQFDYFWVDESNAMVWEATYMSNTCTVVEYDLGKTMKCLVTVTDRVTKESTTVASNQLGPINRPIIPEFDVWVDSELYDDPDQQVGVALNGTVVIEVRQQPASNPAVDLAYRWQIRSGTGRLSGDESATGIIYIAPDAAPAGALVTCTVSSTHAGNTSAQAAEVTILISE